MVSMTTGEAFARDQLRDIALIMENSGDISRFGETVLGVQHRTLSRYILASGGPEVHLVVEHENEILADAYLMYRDWGMSEFKRLAHPERYLWKLRDFADKLVKAGY